MSGFRPACRGESRGYRAEDRTGVGARRPVTAVHDRRADRVRDILGRVSPTDAVAVLDELDPALLASVVALEGDEVVASLLAGGAAEMATRLIGKLSRAQAADVLEEMEPDVVEGMDRAEVAAFSSGWRLRRPT